MASTINCPYCGKLTDANLDNCPHCGGHVKQKSAAQARPGRSGRQTCPNCKAMVQEGDIICVVCGTNLLTGKKVTDEVAASESSISIGWWVGLGVAALVVVVVGILWIYAATNDPVKSAMRLIAQRDYLEAQEVLTNYVNDTPGDERALFELGRLQWRVGQYSQAAESFERVVGLNPRNTDAALWAVAAIGSTPAPASRDKQIGLLKRVVDAEPDDVAIRYLLALARGAKGDIAGQIADIEVVLASRPTDGASRYSLGLGHALVHDYRQSRTQLSMVPEGNHAGNALAALGFMSVLSGASDDAIQYLDSAAEQDTVALRGVALTELGRLLMGEGRFREAQDYLARASQIRAADDAARYLHAVCVRVVGRPADALSEFQALTRAGGRYATSALVQAAEVALAMGDVSEARTLIERANRQNAGGPAFFTVRGRVFMRDGNDAAAEDMFNRAVRADPNYAPAYLESGLLKVRREQLGNGLNDLETYLRLLGQDVAGTRAADVRALTDQLRQAAGGSERRAQMGTGRARL